MDASFEGIITILVRDGAMRLELVKDLNEEVDVTIAPDNPRWKVLMALLGDRLRVGPIVCNGKMEVDMLIASISKNEPFEAFDTEGRLVEVNAVSDDLRVQVCTSDMYSMYEYPDQLLDIGSIPFHQQLNQQKNRPGREGKKQKVNRRMMHGKRR